MPQASPFPSAPRRRLPPRAGQIVLQASAADLAPSEELRNLYRLSDPSLSELGLEQFLDELLARVQELLSVDTVAILLYDEETQELVARAAQGLEEEVRQGVRIPIGRGFAGRIAEERVAVFIADVDHADILNPLLRERGIRSLLGMPLIVEGELIGVIHVGSLTPRTFGPTDLAVLQAAAARAAPGIERARLHFALEHEHRMTMALQRSLLPKQLVESAGISAAARYMPASSDVGGDWYDVFHLPRGRIGIAIGDVAGHGLNAATLMGQLRSALHSYAVEDHSPGMTLKLVDRFMRTLPDPGMATAAYGVLDPETGGLVLANAGHLPPLVLGGEGGRILTLPPAPPLGAFSYASWPETEAELKGGETILFYTDGLVERPGIPLATGISRLLDASADAGSAEEACQLALDQLLPFSRPDDIALVALHYDAIPEELALRLPAEPSVLADLRRSLRRWLRLHHVDEDAGRQILIAVNEAASNAVEHAYSPAAAEFEVTAKDLGDELVFAVSDTGHWRRPRGEHRGRGLKLIEAVMDEVSVQTSEDGTVLTMRHRRGK